MFKASPGKSLHATLFQNKNKIKGLGAQLKWESPCLASMRPWVQSLVLSKIKVGEVVLSLG
jgi:hypothetical protein